MRVLTFVLFVSLVLLISPVSRSQTPIEALHAAIESDDSEFIESYISAGGDPNVVVPDIGTALQVALDSQASSVTILLLEAGADVNAVDESNKTPPLILAMNIEDSKFYKAILQKGAEIDLPDDRGESAIFHAIKSDQYDAISELIDNGANLELKAVRGLTPLMLAFWLAKANVIDILVANGAFVDGELLAEKGNCALCHSGKAPGIATASFTPHLAGQHAEYTAKQLRDYSSGARTHHKMESPAKALTEEIIIALAEYYQKLPRVENSSTANEEVLILGESVYKNSCSSCHGSNGIDTVDLNTPTLAGLNALYTKLQFSFYKEGRRVNDPDAAMRSIATGLSETEIEAVAEYIKNMH